MGRGWSLQQIIVTLLVGRSTIHTSRSRFAARPNMVLTTVKLLFVLPILLLVPPSAGAKCASDFFVFSGTVIDRAGRPLSGASIGISWSDWDGVGGPALAVTDSKGQFSLPIAFDTYSGKGAVVEDLCHHRVRSVSFSSYKGQLQSTYQRVTIGPSRNVVLPTSVVWLQPDGPPSVRLIRPGD